MSFLRQLTAAALTTLVVGTGHAQTIFTYGDKAVSKEEFLKAYNKNNTDAQTTGKAYRDYLELYARFKIKVQAALDLQLDTLPTQRAELTSFRNQVVESYMNDEASLNLMVDEALERSKKDLHIAHIFVALDEQAPEADVQKALTKITEAARQLENGEDFGQVAQRFSEDPVVSVNKGDLGFITVFILPYELESIVYNTPPGKTSAPYRSRIGYHLFRNLGERKAVGKIRAAQILFGFPPEATEVQQQELAQRADSIYRALQQGADFKSMVAQFSTDNVTYHSNGEMLDFGIGQYEPAFEEAAFALSEDGEISRPVRTSFGYHILKRLQRLPVPETDSNNNWRDEIRFQVQRSDRMAVAKKALYKKILERVGFKKYPVNEQELWNYADSILRRGNAPGSTALNDQTPLFSFGKEILYVKDWKEFLVTTIRVGGNRAVTAPSLFEEFMQKAALDYYRNNLEVYNPEFAAQLHEFLEGNLLFEIMQEKVWEKAATDSAGLEAYYTAHRDKYWWEASADAIIFTTGTPAQAEETKEKIRANPAEWRALVEAGNGALQADSGRFELGQIPVLERTNFTPGLLTADVKNETDNSISFAYIITVHQGREPRSFADARGFVINDYQNELEEKWIAELKKKYPVRVREKVVKSLTQ